ATSCRIRHVRPPPRCGCWAFRRPSCHLPGPRGCEGAIITQTIAPAVPPGSRSPSGVYNAERMRRPSRARLLVALDAGCVSGGAVARGAGGYRLASHARVALGGGALVPSPFAPNIADPAEVAEALRQLARSLGFGSAPACLLLPDGLARLALLEVPADVTPQEYGRFRLGPGLPYAAEEAVIDVLPLGGGRAVVAAVRRSVVQGYEAAAAQAGISQERLDLTPLAALSGLLREPVPP